MKYLFQKSCLDHQKFNFPKFWNKQMCSSNITNQNNVLNFYPGLVLIVLWTTGPNGMKLFQELYRHHVVAVVHYQRLKWSDVDKFELHNRGIIKLYKEPCIAMLWMSLVIYWNEIVLIRSNYTIQIQKYIKNHTISMLLLWLLIYWNEIMWLNHTEHIMF